MPIIQRAVEGTKQGVSSALAQTDSDLRASGLAGTPYGQNIKASAAQQGAGIVSAVPNQVLQQFLSMAFPFITSTQGQAMQGAEASAEAQARLGAADISARAQQQNEFWSQVFSSSQLGAGGLGGGGGGGGIP